MSKIQKKLKKNIKKQKEKEKKEYPFKNQVLYFAKILAIIILLAILVSAITLISNKTYKLDDEPIATDYKTILAGQSFTRNEEDYYVVFYKESDLVTTIDAITTSTIYKVDLNSRLNSSVLSNESNKDATNATELKIKETTLMKIEDGKNTLYIEGYDKVTEYLKRI